MKPVAPVTSDRPRWVHHGSSISHGSVATYPTEPWPVVAARLAGLDLVNLGFGGSALLDPFVARTIRDTPADRISLKLGINLVNLDLMRLRAFGPAVHGFLDTIRDGHPHTPLLVISPSCARSTNTPRAPAPSTRTPSPASSTTSTRPAPAEAGVQVHLAGWATCLTSNPPSAAASSSTTLGNSAAAPVKQGSASAPDWTATASVVSPSVVSITATTGQGGGQGSGVIID